MINFKMAMLGYGLVNYRQQEIHKYITVIMSCVEKMRLKALIELFSGYISSVSYNKQSKVLPTADSRKNRCYRIPRMLVVRSCTANSGASVCPMSKLEETEKETSPRTRKGRG